MSNPNGFDLSTAPDLGAIEDEGVVLELRDEHDEPMTYGADKKPVTITVCGTYSTTYLNVIKEQKRRFGKKLGRGGNISDITEGHDIEAMVACVKAWEGFTANGSAFPCTKANVTAVLTSSKAQHIRTQVERVMGDHERFFKQG